MAASFKWWAKDSHRGTAVVVKMENPNYSMVELESPSREDILLTGSPKLHREKGRGRNAKQLTWVLLLKAHRAAGCLTSIAAASFGLAAAIKRRVADGHTDADNDIEIDDEPAVERDQENPTFKTRFYSFLKVCLFLSVLLLGFEVAAYFKGWHFGPPHLQLGNLLATPFGFKDLFGVIYTYWVRIRVDYLAPPLQLLANVCIFLFLIQSLDRLVLCLGCLWIRIRKIKPIAETGLIDVESVEEGFFPMVLVQIPMCNEREVSKLFPFIL